MSIKTRTLTAIAIIALGLVYAAIFAAITSDVTADSIDLVMTLIRIEPWWAFIVIGGLLLGPIWGAGISAVILLGGYIFIGLRLEYYLPISVLQTYARALAYYVAAAVCAGLFSKIASSFKLLLLGAFCSLLLGHLVRLIIEYVRIGWGLPIRGLVESWIHFHGFAVLLLSVVIAGICLAFRHILQACKK